ncbi:MAG: hypothetical protein JSR98_14285 [Proteobacteria bacterium]|nr:hypothetical protein [Pseudomonadota bacterium]
MKTRVAAVAALLIGLGALDACSKGGAGGAAGPVASADGSGGPVTDLNASLKPEEAKWRTEIVASNPLCQQTGADQKCKNFNVECKAERDLKADDAGKGVTNRVVAAMTFSGWDPKLKQSQDGTSTVEFVKTAAGWTHSDHPPVNLSTCADM